MKLLILADIDDFHWKHGTGEADVVLSCGDVSDQVILEAAEAHDCHRILAVKGNHDTNAAFTEPIVNLHLSFCEYSGVSFGGINGAWRYKQRGHFLYDQTEVQGLLGAFPPVHVFLSHNSPRGVHDRNDEVHYGFEGLNTYITRAKPKILIHGHLHVNRESIMEETRIIGVYGYRLTEV